MPEEVIYHQKPVLPLVTDFLIPAGAALGALILLLQIFPFTIQAKLPAESIQPVQGYAYAAPLPDILEGRLSFLLSPASDSNNDPKASGVRLLEQNTPLARPHSVHKEIVDLGAGRFSHWNNQLILSATDNSDPRSNHRAYSIGYPLAPPLWLAALLALPALWRGMALLHPSTLRRRASQLIPLLKLGGTFHRASGILMTAGAALGALILLLQIFPFTIQAKLPTESIQPVQGYAYAAPLPDILEGRLSFLLSQASDSNNDPQASGVRLLEQNTPLARPHSIHKEIIDLGAGRFSHWDNQLILSATDNSDPRSNHRAYSIEYPFTPPLWLAVLLALPALWSVWRKYATQGELVYPARLVAHFLHAFITRPYWFWAFAASLALFYNIVYWVTLSAPIMAPDSDSYLTWSRFRTIGYPSMLYAYQALGIGWTYLPIFQLNLMLGGLLVLAYALGRLCNNYAASWLFLALAHAGGALLLYPAHMLTEGPFASILMIHFGIVLLLLNKQSLIRALLAGLALAGAIMIKSVGVVLLAPLILIVLFSPPLRRLSLMAALLLPGLAAYLGPSAYNYARIGVFESSVAGGFALSGHVGWGIRATPQSPYEELGRRIETRLEPVLASRPAHFSTLEEYATYTTSEYNTLLWQNISPETRNYLACKLKACTWEACEANYCILMMNKALLSLSKEAILRSPAEYVYHVFAHYYGMWRYVFNGQDFMRGIYYYADLLPTLYTQNNRYWQRKLGYSADQIKNFDPPLMGLELKNSVGGKFVNLITLQNLLKHGVYKLNFLPQIMLGFSLIACFLVFRLHRLSPATVAFCYGGLLMNAYFLGHALAQVALDRYAMLMQGIAFAVLILGLSLFIKRFNLVASPTINIFLRRFHNLRD
jgi:hypothetical protein